jgi:hypothetical protein
MIRARSIAPVFAAVLRVVFASPLCAAPQAKEPVASNDAEEGRARNRRAELVKQ